MADVRRYHPHMLLPGRIGDSGGRLLGSSSRFAGDRRQLFRAGVHGDCRIERDLGPRPDGLPVDDIRWLRDDSEGARSTRSTEVLAWPDVERVIGAPNPRGGP